MKDSQTWITEIDFEIARLKLNGRHTFYQFCIDMTKEIAGEIERYFKDKYETEVRRCRQCANKYDIILQF